MINFYYYTSSSHHRYHKFFFQSLNSSSSINILALQKFLKNVVIYIYIYKYIIVFFGSRVYHTYPNYLYQSRFSFIITQPRLKITNRKKNYIDIFFFKDVKSYLIPHMIEEFNSWVCLFFFRNLILKNYFFFIYF